MKAVAKAREELESLPLMHVGELLSINDYPTRANTHAQVDAVAARVVARAAEAPPTTTAGRDHAAGQDRGVEEPPVRLQAFKRLLIYGARLNLLQEEDRHRPRLWLTPTLVN